MSSLIESARKRLSRGSGLDDRVGGLAAAVEASRGRLDDADVDAAARVVERAETRLRLSSQHTVVALAGATGSGKSSTFNQLTGLDLAAVGVRRPTTSWTTACIWGREGASELLDWLGIPARHQVVRDSMLDKPGEGKLEGLVLLDLPDHDSTEVGHHLEVDRLIELADLMVWVLDPQKYADAAIHDKFLRPMAEHKDVMLVVLNHIDEVAPQGRSGLVSDARRLLDADGLDGVPLLPISARTGEGIDELKKQITTRVKAKEANRTRISRDVSAAARALQERAGDADAPHLDKADRERVVDAVADAAGVPLVVDAVERATRTRATRATGWPVVSWVSRLRPDPLKRLHLDLGASNRDLVAAARSSLPGANHVQRAKVEAEVRDLADNAAAGLARPWAQAVRRASVARSADLTDGLDHALTSVDLGVEQLPWWCRAVRVLQWLLLLAAVAGGVWLAVLAVVSYLRMPAPATPSWHGLPVPTLLLLGGVVLGIVLGLVSRVIVAMAARNRARRADRRLRDAMRSVTQELVVDPVEAEIEAYGTAREGLRRALA